MNKFAPLLGMLLAAHSVFVKGDDTLFLQKVLFAYQYYVITTGGVYKINTVAKTKYGLESCMEMPKGNQPISLGYMYWHESDRDGYGILNDFALKHGLGPHSPFPPDILAVEGVPVALPFSDFYVRCIQGIHNDSNWRYERHHCELVSEDRITIGHVLKDTSDDKHILFIGFDASSPTEGRNILCNTLGYRHSLLWSDSITEATHEHNRIKSCFCKSQALLDLGLDNYFDYIIIGGQTVKYINLETWKMFCYFLKPGGCIVYPEMVWYYWGGEIINHLLNTFGRECESDAKFKFELFRQDNPEDPIFSEIKALTRFNNVPTHGSFCYGSDKSYAVYIHKKT